jgi:hypothetical protein
MDDHTDAGGMMPKWFKIVGSGCAATAMAAYAMWQVDLAGQLVGAVVYAVAFPMGCGVGWMLIKRDESLARKKMADDEQEPSL